MYWFHYDRSEVRLKKSLEAARKAIEIDPLLADGYEAMGWYYYHGFLEYDLALAQFDEALRRRPQNATVTFGIAAVYRRQGKFKESLVNFEKACTIDPRDPMLLFNTGETHVLLRNYGTSRGYLDRAIVLSPDWPSLYSLKAASYLWGDGDFASARAVLQNARTKGVAGMEYHLAFVSYLERDFAGALEMIRQSPDNRLENQFIFLPRNLLRGDLFRLTGEPSRARTYYDSARIDIETALKNQPDDPRLHAALGITLASLGLNEEALNHARRAVELLPMSREAYRGAYIVEALAKTYTLVGNHENAVEQLEHLLSVPSQLSPTLVRLDPAWDPLRNNPRFQKLVAGKQ